MAVLSLNLRYFSRVEGSIKSAITELERRQSDYEGIIRDVNNIKSSSGNLSSCNIYLKKKNAKLQDKIDKLNSFKNKVATFSDNAKKADKRVATYVKNESKTFYKTVGIKTGLAAGWENFKKDCKWICKKVKKFYDDHKYIIDAIVDAALLVVAVVALIAAIPTGGATLVFAVFALAQATADYFTSCVALGCHFAGDDESAGIWAERGLKDAVKSGGHILDTVFEKITGIQTNFYENLAGFAYDVTCIASFGYGIFKTGKDFIKFFKNGNFRKISIKGIKTIFGLDLTPGESNRSYKNIIKFFKLNNGKEAYNLVRVCKGFKNIKTTVNMGKSIHNRTFLTEGVDIVKNIKSRWDDLISAHREFDVGQLHKSIIIPSFPLPIPIDL